MAVSCPNVVFPQASSAPERGVRSVAMFASMGANHAEVIELDDRDAAIKKIDEADLIWFPGGQQSQLLKLLGAADLIDLIRERHREGVLIGGTSAGAAAMSESRSATTVSPTASCLCRSTTEMLPLRRFAA